MRTSLIILMLAVAIACGPSDGLQTEKYGNGNTKEEGMIKQGEKSGKWVFYWSNGNVQVIGHYDKGKPAGTWLYHNEQGKQVAEGTYRNGKMWEGTFVRYVMGTKKFMTVKGGKQE